MALHRAEQIVAAVVGKVTGLTTTSTRVYRSRTAPLPDAGGASLVVYQGTDNPRSDGGSSSFMYIDGDLTIVIEASLKGATDAAVETALNLIRKEVTVALAADRTQGLNFVHNTTEGPATPDIQREGEKPTGRMRMEFAVHYRRSRTDPSA